MFRVIKGEKIKEQRGKRTLKEVVEASGGIFSEVSLSGWENETFKPKDDKVPALLKGLGCNFEDISEPVELSLS